jgi:opacity protein-like surface antigen
MRLFVFLAALLLAPALLAAQSIEVIGVTGGAQVWDDEGNIGFGAPLGAGEGFKSPQGWGIEAIVETQQAQRNFSSGVSFDSTFTAGRVRLLKYFGTGATQPYAGGGLGLARITSSRTEPPGFGGVFSSSRSSGILSGFAGVGIPAGDRLFVRPEFEVSKFGEHLRMGGNVAIGVSW